MPDDKKKKPPGAKPWAQRVAALQRVKAGRRKFWSRARWTKHLQHRASLRERERLPRIMWRRRQRKHEIAMSAARSERMRAYHARRRAARTLAAPQRDA